MNKRFSTVRARINDLVANQDAFGIAERTGLRLNTVFQFETNPGKVSKFQEWLQKQIDGEILSRTSTGDPWSDGYIDSAYKKGVVRAYTDAQAAKLTNASDKVKLATQEQYLLQHLAAGEHKDKLQLLYSRAFTKLKDVTTTMDAQLSTVLADGLSNGINPRELARRLTKEVDNLNVKRARAIARTEIIHAHAEGQLDSFERLGVEELGVMAEWATAGDDLVCPLCLPLQGEVFPLKQARGIIPRHPNCRCTWIPAQVGETKKKPKLGKTQTAITKSTIAETGIKVGWQAKKASRWLGSEKWVTKKPGVKPGTKLKPTKAPDLDLPSGSPTAPAPPPPPVSVAPPATPKPSPAPAPKAKPKTAPKAVTPIEDTGPYAPKKLDLVPPKGKGKHPYGLNNEEIGSLDSYQGSHYQAVNDFLRKGGKPMDANGVESLYLQAQSTAIGTSSSPSGIAIQQKKFPDYMAAQIDSAIAKAPALESQTVYRGIVFNSQDQLDYAKLTKKKPQADFLKGLKVGDEYQELAYSSTSVQESAALKFTNPDNLKEGLGDRYVLRIKTQEGARGISMSESGGLQEVLVGQEEELLLARGFKGKVTAIAKKDGVTYIDLDQVPAGVKAPVAPKPVPKPKAAPKPKAPPALSKEELLEQVTDSDKVSIQTLLSKKGEGTEQLYKSMSYDLAIDYGFSKKEIESIIGKLSEYAYKGPKVQVPPVKVSPTTPPKPTPPPTSVPVKGFHGGTGKHSLEGYTDLVEVQSNIGGSTGAKWVKLKNSSGVEENFIMKAYNGNEEQVLNEALANLLYKEASATVGAAPQTFVGYVDGKKVLFTKRLENHTPLGQLTGTAREEALKKASEEFVTDAWLANWDSVGLSMDNILVSKGGRVSRVDNGGALFFRAQGAKKGSKFGYSVQELDTLRDASLNPTAAKVFGQLTDQNILDQIDIVTDNIEKKLANGKLIKLAEELGYSKAEAQKINLQMMGRRDSLLAYKKQLLAKPQIAATSRSTIDDVLKGLPEVDSTVPYKVVDGKRVYTRGVNTLKDDDAFITKNLTQAEMTGIQKFTGAEYRWMNPRIVENVEGDWGDYVGDIRAIDQAYDKLPRYQGLSARGVGGEEVAAQFEKYKTGEWAEVWWKSFSSTSIEADTEFGSEGGVCYLILNRGKQGAYVDPISSHRGERELLMKRDSRFRAVAWAQSQNGVGKKKHKKILVIEELEEGTVPLTQEAIPEVNAEELWESYRQDSRKRNN